MAAQRHGGAKPSRFEVVFYVHISKFAALIPIRPIFGPA
jgi:hypothetical protein